MQSKDLAASLDRKIDESQKSSDERASRIEEALKNTKDDLLAKISQATADLEDKTKREIEATRDEVTKDLSQKVSRSIIGLVNLVSLLSSGFGNIRVFWSVSNDSNPHLPTLYQKLNNVK